jgi:hypothetical protein
MLITLLPPLLLHQDWPTHLVTLLPLHAGLTYPLAPNPIIKAKMSLVIAEVVHWYPDQGILLRRPRSEVHCKPVIPYIKEWARCQLVPTPILQYHMDIEGARRHNTDNFTVDCFAKLDHWTFSISRNKSIRVINAAASGLRMYWRNKSDNPVRIPLRIGAKFASLLSKAQWNMFWQSAIPHNARTPWWRLLHDKIPHRIRLHRRQPDKVDSALCGICKNVLEDDFHLLVGCTLKWCVWQKALRELSLDSTLSTKDEVWLTLLLDKKMLTKTQGNLLPFIGLILVNIWQIALAVCHRWRPVVY